MSNAQGWALIGTLGTLVVLLGSVCWGMLLIMRGSITDLRTELLGAIKDLRDEVRADLKKLDGDIDGLTKEHLKHQHNHP